MKEIRKASSLVRLYKNKSHPISENAPELIFMRAVCAGDADQAVELFEEEKLFGGQKTAVDAPHGRFEGKEGIKRFAESLLDWFHADHADIVPVIQTRANGRSITELVINFETEQWIDQVPMFVIGDLRTPAMLDEVRIYFHCTYLPQITPYRKPVFQSSHLEMGEPGLLTGAVREYYEALHHVPSADVDRILGAMEDHCMFGGYEPLKEGEHEVSNKDEMRKKFEHMASYIPHCVGMRYETLTDDGKNCIIEWVHIVSEAGQKELSRVALSGVAAYERGESGLLCAVRISDYAGYEREIDWNKAGITKEEAYSINLVKEFPAWGNK
ncbi:MAG: hypothetical protein KH366_26430 [Clostridiaceae bacterium]|nr:hypothetical protein [Clostridiaceae bacterium]